MLFKFLISQPTFQKFLYINRNIPYKNHINFKQFWEHIVSQFIRKTTQNKSLFHFRLFLNLFYIDKLLKKENIPKKVPREKNNFSQTLAKDMFSMLTEKLPIVEEKFSTIFRTIFHFIPAKLLKKWKNSENVMEFLYSVSGWENYHK